ncbi:MAG: ATP-binding protein, partial [bacterium]
MRNPFVYGEEAADEAFCNRRSEITELIRDIGNGVNVIIFSPRRYGKTSLIKQVMKKLANKRTVSIYVDLYPAVSKQKFLELYATAIAKALSGKVEAKLKTLKELFPRLIPKIVIKGEAGTPEFEFDYDRTKRASLYLNDLLEAVKKYADEHGMNAVVVLDEIQEILQYEDDEIEKAMRSAFQSHRNVSYIFLG